MPEYRKVISSSDGYFHVIEDGHVVAKVDGRAEADGVAALPHLIKALQQMVRIFDPIHNDPCGLTVGGQAIMRARDALDLADGRPPRVGTPAPHSGNAEAWREGEYLNGHDGQRVPIKPGLYRYSGFGVGTLFLPGGRKEWTDSTKAAGLCREAGLAIDLFDPLRYYCGVVLKD